MKNWTIRKFAKHIGIDIVGNLVRYPEYEYDNNYRFYADDRAEQDNAVYFWISKGQVEIYQVSTDIHFDSNNY